MLAAQGPAPEAHRPEPSLRRADFAAAEREAAILSRRQGRAPRSWAAPQAGKASSRCRDFRIPASGSRYSRWIDRTRCAREIAAPARRFSCRGSTACYEGPLATHPGPAGAIPHRGLLHSPLVGAQILPSVALRGPVHIEALFT